MHLNVFIKYACYTELKQKGNNGQQLELHGGKKKVVKIAKFQI